MNYIKSEHLKLKHTFMRKLILIAPFTTAILALLIGGISYYQPMTFYWWYAFLLPGTIALFCAMSNQKEERATKYYSVYSQPINLKHFWYGKIITLSECTIIAGVVLALLVSSISIISPATVVFSPFKTVIGSLLITFTALWQIPLCLFLSKKTHVFFPVLLNSVLGIFIPIIVGNTSIWWLFPHCYGGKLSEPFMGIGLNGVFTSSDKFSFSAIPITLILSFILFLLFSLISAKWFERQEVK